MILASSMIIMWMGVLGALMNRIRGGMFDIPFNGPLNALVFGATAGFATQNWLTGLLATAAMFMGQAPGWGRYIGAIGGWEKKELEEFALVDFFIKPLRGNMRLWGGAGLALRGFFWAALIAAALKEPLLGLVGLAMPLAYLSGFQLAKWFRATNWQGTGWELGEAIFGAILWASTFFAIIN